MLDGGALASIMSGSGPSVFGVFKSVEDAEAVAVKLRSKGYFAGVAFPTARR